MTLITLLVAIALTTIMLSLPGLAPYVHAFVGVAKYPAYAYFAWQYAPSVLRHLLLVEVIAVRVARLSRVWHSGRRLITPLSLFSAAMALSLWLLQTVVTRTSLLVPIFAVSRILTDHWHKFSVWSSVQAHFHPLTLGFSKLRERIAQIWAYILEHIDRYLVEPCSVFASGFCPCALSHAMAWVVTSGFDATMPASIWPMISRYPLSFSVGFLSLIVMWRCALKAIILGGLGIDAVAYTYLVIISRLARILLSLRLGHWVVLGLSLKYVFDTNDISRHEVVRAINCTIIAFVLREDILSQHISELSSLLRRAARQCGFRLVHFVKCLCIASVQLSVRLITSGLYLVLRQAGRMFKHMLLHVVRLLVFSILYWTCVACVMGCVLAATIATELFAAMILPVYHLYSLAKLQYQLSKNVPSVSERLAPHFESSGLPSVPSEACLSTPPTSSSRSRSATSDSVGRLARLINAYLDESVSGESVVELENQLGNTRSIHAPPITRATFPLTPLFSAPTTPAPGSSVPLPVLPEDLTQTPTQTPDLSFESADEDEQVASLATQLSDFHIEFGSGSTPRESKCVSPRATIMFEPYIPSSWPGPVIPVQQRRTSLDLQQGAGAWLYLESGVGRTVL
ncbi:hypothetical protein RhiJN_09227 [Ceratobasidium sp. AG-Ba]|nr:hypothetical protein RhiJN_09227 [Ceratobasidium sp. AG-Ba]